MTTFGFSRAEDSPGFLLWQMANLWQRRIRAALAPLGITHVQFVLLAGIAWLTDTGQTVTQVALAMHAHTDIMMTSQVVRTLEDRGLITRTAHPTDTRAKLLALTAEGRAVTQRAVTLVEAADARFFADIPDLAPFIATMQHLIAANVGAE
jgi:DNA-binding MarR family transcriptional regulator